MRTVSAREANQRFSRLLERAAKGEEVTITRRGVPVARLVPVVDGKNVQAERASRKAAALAWFKSGALKGGVVADWTREELYEERLDHPWRPVE